MGDFRRVLFPILLTLFVLVVLLAVLAWPASDLAAQDDAVITVCHGGGCDHEMVQDAVAAAPAGVPMLEMACYCCF